MYRDPREGPYGQYSGGPKIRIEIPEDLLFYLYPWVSEHRNDSEEFNLLWIMFERKVDAMIDHEYFSGAKTAPTPEARAEWRTKYLERRGIDPDWHIN